MNSENTSARRGVGRSVVAIVLGALAAIFTPVTMLISAPIFVLLYRWAGKTAGIIYAMLSLLFGTLYIGVDYIWVAALIVILPVLVLFRNEKLPFFTQLKGAIASFGLGLLIVVVVFSVRYGSNLIAQLFDNLLMVVKTMPRDVMEEMLRITPSLSGLVTVPSIINATEQLVKSMVPLMQEYLPGFILSHLVTVSVFCTWASNRMKPRVEGESSTFVPVREWALPASVTIGLLTITVALFIMNALGLNLALAGGRAALDLSITVFSIQCIAGMQRRGFAIGQKTSRRRIISVIIIVLYMAGGAVMVAVLGCMSAIIGTRGAIRQIKQARVENKDNKE